MPRLSNFSIATVCVLLLLNPATGLVAGETKPAPPPPGYAAARSEDPWRRRLKELHFEGVPLAEVARFLDEQFPEVNFVLSPGEIELPVSLKLRDVTLDDVFTALQLATNGRARASKVNQRMVNINVVEVPPAEPVPKKICRALSIARFLSGRSDDQMEMALKDLEDALNRCWDMLQEANPADPTLQRPQLSLHRATKLLIVVGAPEQLAVVEEVVNQLEGVPAPPMIDPATGLPMGPVGGYGAGLGGGGGGRAGSAGYGGGAGGRPGVDPAAAEAFRRRYGIEMQPGQPVPPVPPVPAVPPPSGGPLIDAKMPVRPLKVPAPPTPAGPSTNQPESSK